jgi:hypothetical protein
MLRFIETEYNQLMFFLSMLCPGGESEVKPFSVYPKTSAAEYNQLSKLTHILSFLNKPVCRNCVVTFVLLSCENSQSLGVFNFVVWQV